MGWTSENRPKGISHDEWFAPKLNKGSRIIASTQADGLYAALIEDADGHLDVLPVSIQWSPRSFWNFTYKDLPAEPSNAIGSATMIRLIDRADNVEPRLREWAEQSRRRLAFRAWVKSLREGDTIKLPYSLTFSGGSEHDTFTMRERQIGRTRRLIPSVGRQGFRFKPANFPGLRIIRADGTVETNPNVAYADEDAYVARVEAAWWAARTPERADGPFKARYGYAWISDVMWCARQEHRDGNLWDTIEQDVPARDAAA